MKDWYNTIIFAVAALLLWSFFTKPDNVNISLTKTTMPQPEVIAYKDQGFTWDKIKEYDVSVVKLYASWCGFCRKELPLMAELKKANVAPLFGIAVSDKEKDMDKLFTRFENPYMYNSIDPNKKAMHAFGIRGLPTTIIVDRDMNIRFMVTGALTEYGLTNKVIPLIKQIKEEYKTKNKKEEDVK